MPNPPLTRATCNAFYGPILSNLVIDRNQYLTETETETETYMSLYRDRNRTGYIT